MWFLGERGRTVVAVCTAYHRVYALVSAKLGRCSKCMGLSLTGAVVGWLVLAAAVYFWHAFPFAHLLAVWPVSLTALWLLHIVTFAGRGVVREVRERQQFREITPATGPTLSRRQMAKVFASGLVFAAVVSVAAAAAEAAGNHCCGGSCVRVTADSPAKLPRNPRCVSLPSPAVRKERGGYARKHRRVGQLEGHVTYRRVPLQKAPRSPQPARTSPASPSP